MTMVALALASLARLHSGLIGSNEGSDGFGTAADDRHFQEIEFDAGSSSS